MRFYLENQNILNNSEKEHAESCGFACLNIYIRKQQFSISYLNFTSEAWDKTEEWGKAQNQQKKEDKVI